MLASRPVALLALHAVTDRERVVLLPVLRVGAGGVAAQAEGRFLGLDGHAADRGDRAGLGRGQAGVGPGVLRLRASGSSGGPCSRRRGRSRRPWPRRRPGGAAGPASGDRPAGEDRPDQRQDQAPTASASIRCASLVHSGSAGRLNHLEDLVGGHVGEHGRRPVGPADLDLVGLRRPCPGRSAAAGRPATGSPATGIRSSICTSVPAVTVTRAPIASVLPFGEPGDRPSASGSACCRRRCGAAGASR